MYFKRQLSNIVSSDVYSQGDLINFLVIFFATVWWLLFQLANLNARSLGGGDKNCSISHEVSLEVFVWILDLTEHKNEIKPLNPSRPVTVFRCDTTNIIWRVWYWLPNSRWIICYANKKDQNRLNPKADLMVMCVLKRPDLSCCYVFRCHFAHAWFQRDLRCICENSFALNALIHTLHEI